MFQKSKIVFLISICLFYFSLEAQKGADMEARPEGGFSKNIAGTWKCGELGTMVLKQNGNQISGTYATNGGKVKGVSNGNSVTGTWTEKDGSKGDFEWEISIERMTPKPTHLRGHWKNEDVGDWEDEWVCTR